MKIVTGKPAYVTKKIAENIKLGYIVDEKHIHPNGDITVRLILK